MSADLTMSNEKRLAVAGDWHSNRLGVRSALSRIHRDAPDVHTVLHLRDFNLSANRPWVAHRKSLLDLMCGLRKGDAQRRISSAFLSRSVGALTVIACEMLFCKRPGLDSHRNSPLCGSRPGISQI
jgi:hypothetical protein